MQITTLITGTSGMVGSALKRLYRDFPKHENHILLTPDKDELNLESKESVEKYFNLNKINRVFHAASKVGGIKANIDYPADFITSNLNINSNIFEISKKYKVSRLIFFGSSCIYPKASKIPIREDSLMTGRLEETNSAYAVSKIAAIEQCRAFNKQYGCDFRVLMPTNLYGINDYYNEQKSHVIPALINKFFHANEESKESITIWGSGNAIREFLHADDLAKASFHVMNIDHDQFQDFMLSNSIYHLNVGSGYETSIRDLCLLLKELSNFKGKILFDKNMPDGVKIKTLSSKLINSLNWNAGISFKDGLTQAYDWFQKNYPNIRT